MPFDLSSLTEWQLLEYYEQSIRDRAKRHGLNIEPISHGAQGKMRHDLWSIYAYGEEIKAVYIKTAPKIKNAPQRKNANEGAREGEAIPKKEAKAPRTTEERFSQSLSRTRARIFELALCNEFQYFCTFTQDQTKRERFDLKAFRKDFSQMVRDLNKSRAENQRIKYLLIPEQHKNGAWHMHGLLMGLTSADLREFSLSEKLPENIRKSIFKGKKVYNWEKYSKKFGFFTCTEIENKTACGKYITKYITKELEKTARENNEHLFFASQGLKGREVIVKNSLDVCPVKEWDFENEYVKVKWFSLSKKLDCEN